MAMDHAAAHERLADLALEPRRLRALGSDASSEAGSLRAHLVECRDCRSELDAWRRVYAGLDAATSEASARLRSLEPSVPSAPSAALRARTLAAVAASARDEDRGIAGSAATSAASNVRGDRATPATELPGAETGEVIPIADRPAGGGGDARLRSAPERARSPRLVALPEIGSRLGRLGWLAAAAALVLAVGFGGLLVQRSGETDRARSETAELAATTATLDRILAAPTHWVVTLRTADGAAGGTLAWSSSEIAVLTSTLGPPEAGTTYRCWIERDGARTPVGTMSFSGSVGYWAGSTSGWSALQKGSRFGVTAVPSGGSGGPAVLVAEL